MNTLTGYLFLAIYLPPLIKVIFRLKNIFILYRWKIHDIKRFHKGIIEIEDLHRLTPREFEEWCGEFLKNSGYTDVQVLPAGPDGGKDIICKEGKDTVYVECKRYSPSVTAPFKVHSDIVKKLAGAMVHDGVYRGLIITTGVTTKSARLCANSIPAPYTVQIIDCNILIEKCLNNKLYSTVEQS